MHLEHKHCTPCRGGISPLTPDEAAGRQHAVPEWTLQQSSTCLVRRFEFADYAAALAFVTAISAIAEDEGHHPDVCFGWGYANVTLYTHKISGLHENDFIMAAKFDRVFADGAGESG